ncbi:MAG: serine hydrolase domain-containing protein [Gemmatimonadales bacterium]
MTWAPSVRCAILLLAAASGSATGQARRAAPEPYYPPRWEWATRRPEDVGMSSSRLEEVATFARANEATGYRDGNDLATSLAGEPYNEIVGPTMRRGGTNGMVIRHGYLVFEWGDTRQVDWTFSATKSYLATTVGLAYDAGLIRDLTEPVGEYVRDGNFASPHNAKITWEQLLQQRSEWQGTLWGKPDWADRYDARAGKRPVLEPGSKYTYNDVRVNLTALAALHVWRRPLPEVFRERIMDPIEASTTWRWHGYDNSWVDLDGLKIQSVSGGGHWGGGLWISARDHARFGLLHLRDGKWKERQLLSAKWIAVATTSSPTSERYGYMWWLNRGPERVAPTAPQSAFYAAGGGGNYVWVDRENDLVVVVRWVPDLGGVIQRVMAALERGSPGQ